VHHRPSRSHLYGIVLPVTRFFVCGGGGRRRRIYPTFFFFYLSSRVRRRPPPEKCRDHHCRPYSDHRRSGRRFGRERRYYNISSFAVVCRVAR